MRRVLLIGVLAMVMLGGVEAARADTLSDTKAWAQRQESRFGIAYDRWSVARLVLTNQDVMRSPEYYVPLDDEADPREWGYIGRWLRKWAIKYDAMFPPLWRRIIHPRVTSAGSWRPLAEWVTHYDPKSGNTVADARSLLRVLSKEYGRRPVLKAPLATMRRINRQWFAEHPHAPN